MTAGPLDESRFVRRWVSDEAGLAGQPAMCDGDHSFAGVLTDGRWRISRSRLRHACSMARFMFSDTCFRLMNLSAARWLACVFSGKR
jgi:hypothetical protein